MQVQTINIEKIENISGINTLGINSSKLLRIFLSDPIQFEPDLRYSRISSVSTETVVETGKENIPEGYNKLVLDTQGNTRIVAENYDSSYIALDLDYPGSLIKVLQNNRNPILFQDLSEDKTELTLNIELDLEEQQVSYVPSSAKLSVSNQYTPISYESLKEETFEPRYMRDIYTISESLDLAWSNSPDLGYRGQISIVNELFKILGYKDESEYPEIPQEIIDPSNRTFFAKNLNRINPYQVKGFRTLINTVAESLFQDEPAKSNFTLKIFQAKTVGSLDIATFRSENLAIRVGDRLTVNTPDFGNTFEIVVTKIRNKIKEGFVIFDERSGDLTILDLTTLNLGNYIVGEPNPSDLVYQVLELEPLDQGQVDILILDLAMAANKGVLSILNRLENTTEELEFPREKISPYPPGIGNSPRSNGFNPAPEGYVHYRNPTTPFDPRNYCTRFNLNKDCNSSIPSQELNSRADSKNRNPFAVPDPIRYSGEAPLGFILPADRTPVDPIYQEYWDKYQNDEPEGGCLAFIGLGEPENVSLCYNVRRCSKRGLFSQTEVLNCVSQTLKGA